jgi:hypothetical protein
VYFGFFDKHGCTYWWIKKFSTHCKHVPCSTLTHSVVSDVRKRARDLGSPLRFMLRRTSLVECVNVLQGTCLQCVEKKIIHQYVQPCLSDKNMKHQLQSGFFSGAENNSSEVSLIKIYVICQRILNSLKCPI